MTNKEANSIFPKLNRLSQTLDTILDMWLTAGRFENRQKKQSVRGPQLPSNY
jgi:hypothetical protein